MIAVITLFLAVCLPASGPDAPRPGMNPPASPSARSAAPEITLKSTPQVQIVYQEHLGPYWTVGPMLGRLREYMLEHGQQGPMFIHYLDNPAAVPPQKLRSEIGFCVTSDHQPEPPYQSAIRGSQMVATMQVQGVITTPPRYDATLRRWSVARGHTPLGSITEILPWTDSARRAGEPIEVQMAIRPMTSRHVSARKQSSPELPRPGPSGSSEPSGQRAATAGRESAPQREGYPEQTAPQMPPSRKRHLEPGESVKELVLEEQFERVAELLMPLDRHFPQAFQLWFGQVVFRIGAVARGIAQVYPGEGSTVTALSDAIRRRYDLFSADFALDPRDQPVLRVDPHSDRHAVRKRGIMRELDAMLGGIALTRLSAEGAEDRLTDIVQRVYEMVSAESSGVS